MDRAQALYVTYLEARLERAIRRMDQSESDGEFEANRHEVDRLKSLLNNHQKDAA